MSQPFVRLAYLSTQAEFRQLSMLSSRVSLGRVTITPERLYFENETGQIVDITTDDIRSARRVREPVYPWYWILVLSIPLLLTTLFVVQYILPGKWTTQDIVLFPSAMALVVVFLYFPVFQRTWVRVVLQSNEEIYLSFVWRTKVVNIVLSRQHDIWSWWLNRGDCKEVVRRLTSA